MNLTNAYSYCLNQGQRLPTARELGLYVQSLGAQGIGKNAEAGYFHVEGSDSAGNLDGFYFSPQGYQRLTGEARNHWLWSSSVHHEYSAYALGFLYDIGRFADFYRFDDYASCDSSVCFGAVRCVRSQ
jgi:hypothetical protein